MAKPSIASRVLSTSLAAAVLWTAPGFAAHAAAATIVRALPPAASVTAGLGSAAMSAPALSLAAPSAYSLSAAPSVSVSPALSAAPLAAAAPTLAPLAAPSAPITPAAAAPALSAAAAPAVTPRAPALSSARSAAAPANAASPSTMLGRLFDGAMSGARYAMSVLPSAADGPDFELPAPGPGRARVVLALQAGLDSPTLAKAVRRLEQYYGFKLDETPKSGATGIALTGTVPTGNVLALANAKEVRGMEILSGGPAPSSGPGLKATASLLMKAVSPAPRREPFVAATRKVADLEKLAKTDPEKAYATATEYVTGRAETRREVRIAALRVLDAMPLAKVLPFYQRILNAYAEAPVQNAKAAGADSVWYIQRMVLLRFARDAAELKSAGLDALVEKQYQDRNSSVRLAAAAALRALGVEPGPENEYLDASHDSPIITPVEAPSVDVPTAPAAKAPAKKSFWQRWKFGLAALMVAGMIGILALETRSTTPAPAPAPAAQTTISAAPSTRSLPTISAAPSVSPAAGAPAAKADTAAVKPVEPSEKQILEQIAQSEKRIADVQEQQLAAQKASQGGLFSGIGGMILSAMIFMGVFWLFGKLFRGGGMGGGGASGSNGMSASTEAKAEVEKPTQRFSDVEGIDESLVDVQETLDYLKDPARFHRMGAKAPKGILFEGPPGTGKTLMARALAGETNSAFFAVSGSDFVELFVGMGARRVRELITKAANHKPAIVFIDEIDAVGKARGNGMNGSDSEREQTINALLTGMDGFDNSGGIIFVAATNRADTLDPALLRPGRFDRKIYVGKPHMGGREAIATIHAKDKRLAPELDLMYVARRTAGLAGADIQNIMNEAALQAIRRGADAIGMQDVDEAIDRGTIGAKRSLPMPDALRRRVAYHEAGHVLANLLNENVDVRQRVNKFTIVPHGSGALGFAEMGTEEGDKYLYTREELEARIDHALGGLVAEKLIFGKSENIPSEWSTGPGSDLEMATNIAKTMVQTLGMGDETGLAVTAPDRRDPMGRAPFGDAVAEKTWREVNKILDASHKRVIERLTRNRHVLEALTQAVLAKETLIGDEIEDVVKKAGPVGPAPEKK